MMRSEEGSAMVESAIVFPLIILSALFTISMMINYYSECSLRSKMHEELRDRAAAGTGTTELVLTEAGKPDIFRAKAESIDITYGEGGGTLSPYISADATERYTGGMLTRSGRIDRVYTARSYSIDEEKGILPAW
ncbi:MAG: hypothetical protein LBL36_02045 [Clostridiales Family XIII bacterium]|jgi:hypothetical protein|nr:hypothetical protein [Clostridiales Family XIII bacterium]